jgi:hypothetical protein
MAGTKKRGRGSDPEVRPERTRSSHQERFRPELEPISRLKLKESELQMESVESIQLTVAVVTWMGVWHPGTSSTSTRILLVSPGIRSPRLIKPLHAS